MDQSISRSVSRSFGRSGRWFRNGVRFWPIAAVVGLVLLGFFLYRAVEGTLQEKLAGDLQTILNADVEALRIWLTTQKATAEALAENSEIEQLAHQLVASAPGKEQEPEQAELRKKVAEALQPALEAHGYIGFMIVDTKQRIVAATTTELVGKDNLAGYSAFLEPALANKVTVSKPHRSVAMLRDARNELRTGVPTMFVVAPIHGADDKVLGALGVRIRPERDFTRILSIGRAGKTGETFAFDDKGLMLSQSRFDEDLKSFGLLPDEPDASSILTLTARDPGVNLYTGQRPTLPRSKQPLNLDVASAIRYGSGANSTGYRDYRGTEVIGAWTWLKDYGFGVTTQTDISEAFRPLWILRVAFGALFALLVVAAAAIYFFMLVASRYRQQMRREAIKAKRLGQYSLDNKIGAGGMGVVYRGHHALLRRPTAIKLLDPERTNAETIGRFEREVQLTSQLSHPNTISIYDFGRTPEGLFYYAMEYIEGIPLDQLVKNYGAQPVGRVIYILRQLCGSLAEAHSIGLVHRDIKPANILLTQRGGLPDFVKLLDFGLVKALDVVGQAGITTSGSLMGTPLYMSPEAIQRPDDVDARSDLYAVGAVGYFLLTGTPPFVGATMVDIFTKQVSAQVEPPSQRLGKSVPQQFENVLLCCLAKAPEQRPTSAAALGQQLAECQADAPWSDCQALAWWKSRDAADETRAFTEAPTGQASTDHTLVFTEPSEPRHSET